MLGRRDALGLPSITRSGGCGSNSVVVSSRQCSALLESLWVDSGCNRLCRARVILNCLLRLVIAMLSLLKVLVMVVRSGLV